MASLVVQPGSGTAGLTQGGDNSHYVLAATHLTTNNEIANRYGISSVEEATVSYCLGKRDQQLAHIRFSCYGPPMPKEPIENLYELETYTSSATGTLKGYAELPPSPDIRSIDRELLKRAEERRREDLASAMKAAALRKVAPRGFLSKPKPKILNLLAERCESEYIDIQEMEGKEFTELTETFSRQVEGDMQLFLYVEARARRLMEDIEHSIAMGLLKQLRELIFESEERLMLRSMGYYPYPPSLRNHRKKMIEEKPPEVLDVMYAAPLWDRVIAIRRETENEECILHLRLHLAFTTQGDLIEQGYMKLDTTSKQLVGLRIDSRTPVYIHESIQFGFNAERFCVEGDEETKRMTIVDKEVAEREDLFKAFREEEDRLIGWLVKKFGSRKGEDKIERLFAFMKKKPKEEESQ